MAERVSPASGRMNRYLPLPPSGDHSSPCVSPLDFGVELQLADDESLPEIAGPADDDSERFEDFRKPRDVHTQCADTSQRECHSHDKDGVSTPRELRSVDIDLSASDLSRDAASRKANIFRAADGGLARKNARVFSRAEVRTKSKVKRHHDVVAPTVAAPLRSQDLPKLRSYFQAWSRSPTVLLHSVWFYVSSHLRNARTITAQRLLKKSDLSLIQEESGTEYFALSAEFLDRLERREGVAVRWTTSSEGGRTDLDRISDREQVSAVKLLLRKLSPVSSRLLQVAKDRVPADPSEPWFTGVKSMPSISRMMKSISENAGLSMMYTNPTAHGCQIAECIPNGPTRRCQHLEMTAAPRESQMMSATTPVQFSAMSRPLPTTSHGREFRPIPLEEKSSNSPTKQRPARVSFIKCRIPQTKARVVPQSQQPQSRMPSTDPRSSPRILNAKSLSQAMLVAAQPSMPVTLSSEPPSPTMPSALDVSASLPSTHSAAASLPSTHAVHALPSAVAATISTQLLSGMPSGQPTFMPAAMSSAQVRPAPTLQPVNASATAPVQPFALLIIRNTTGALHVNDITAEVFPTDPTQLSSSSGQV